VDALSLVIPGAQSLVASILTDGWTQAREALARRWSAKGSISRNGAEQQLERGRELSLQIDTEDAAGRSMLETYWTGYLAGLAAGNADLLNAVRELGQTQGTRSRVSEVHNSNTGTAGTLVQLGDVHGDANISLGH